MRGALFRSARDVAFMSLTTALLLAAQLALSGVAGVEIVTPLFLSYCWVFGVMRGCMVALAFTLLRGALFGFFPNVFVLYLLYYPIFAFVCGTLGKLTARSRLRMRILAAAVCAVVLTACFTLLDDAITPLMLGYSSRAAFVYFLASLPVLGVQCACAAVTVPLMFPPLYRALRPFAAQ